MPNILDKIFGKPVQEAVDAAGRIIDEVVTNDDERLEKKARLAEIITGLTSSLASSAKDVLVTELSGNRLQRSWRPILMLAFGFIICYRYFFAPIFGLTEPDLPEQFWNLLEIGMGGYVIGRSAERVTQIIAGNLDKIPGRKPK